MALILIILAFFILGNNTSASTRAKQLINHFRYLEDYGEFMSLQEAKQSAIEVVDETINNLLPQYFLGSFHKSYWLQVKKEIQNYNE